MQVAWISRPLKCRRHGDCPPGEPPALTWYQTIFELIDMRSFSNLWYWIALAVLWSMASYNVVGVPYDMVTRAARGNGQAQSDLDALAQIRARRMIDIADASGAWLAGLVALILTMLALLGAMYRVEFAQAVFLMALPMTLVGVLALSAARRIAGGGLSGRDLRECLLRHRRTVQAIGTVSIFVTAVWGMYQNLDIGPMMR